MTLALSLYLFQNDSGLRGNNGLSGLQNIPRLENFSQAEISIWFLVLSSLALLIIYFVSSSIVNTKLGNIIIGIRDNENRIRFLGYKVENYKLFIFVISAVISGIAGALYYPQAGIINPAELAPLASIYLAVWVAIGGRGSLYGAIIGAAFVSLTSSYFTGGQIPNIEFGIFTFKWVDWWVVILGFSFVITTLYAPRGIGGLIEHIFKKD
jgi:urea transport system permease protein